MKLRISECGLRISNKKEDFENISWRIGQILTIENIFFFYSALRNPQSAILSPYFANLADFFSISFFHIACTCSDQNSGELTVERPSLE
jgi:hypothetical protein